MSTYKYDIIKYFYQCTFYLLVWTSLPHVNYRLPICSFYRLFGNQRESLFFLVTGHTPFQPLSKCRYTKECGGLKMECPVVQERNNTSLIKWTTNAIFIYKRQYILSLNHVHDFEIARTLSIFILPSHSSSIQSIHSFSPKFSIPDYQRRC